jgi:hypothetical protein
VEAAVRVEGEQRLGVGLESPAELGGLAGLKVAAELRV